MSIKFVQTAADPQKTHDSGLCARNLNLLAHAQSLELDIGSQCGGHGICGGDRVRLSPSAAKQCSAVTPEEREHLSPEEISAGWRLACQCFPNEDDLDIVLEY